MSSATSAAHPNPDLAVVANFFFPDRDLSLHAVDGRRASFKCSSPVGRACCDNDGGLTNLQSSEAVCDRDFAVLGVAFELFGDLLEFREGHLRVDLIVKVRDSAIACVVPHDAVEDDNCTSAVAGNGLPNADLIERVRGDPTPRRSSRDGRDEGERVTVIEDKLKVGEVEIDCEPEVVSEWGESRVSLGDDCPGCGDVGVTREREMFFV